jgi:uncharacterized protein YbaP (TraB family)
MNLAPKFLPRYLLILLCFLFALSAQAQRGILWKIDNGRSSPSYLLGTVHSDDPRILNLPNPIRRKFDQADSFSAELKMDVMTLLESQGMMMLTDGRTLKDIIGQRRYRQCVKLMQARGMPEMLVQQMKPWAVAAQLNLPQSQSGIFLDMKLFQEASVSGKAVYGLETMAEQMGVFEGMSEREQIVFLDESIKHASEVPEMIRRILDLYLAGDLTGLKQYSDRMMARNSSQLTEIFQKRLIVDRNQRMVERMQQRLDEGNAFIAVGALHLPGDKGILRLLEQKGYAVRPVY